MEILVTCLTVLGLYLEDGFAAGVVVAFRTLHVSLKLIIRYQTLAPGYL